MALVLAQFFYQKGVLYELVRVSIHKSRNRQTRVSPLGDFSTFLSRVSCAVPSLHQPALPHTDAARALRARKEQALDPGEGG